MNTLTEIQIELDALRKQNAAAEKTIDVLKKKVISLYNHGAQTSIEKQLQRASERELLNRQRQQDIERKAAAELAAANARIECALDGGRLAIWEFDLKARRFTFDHRWFEIVGRKQESAANFPAYWQRLIHQDDLPEFVKGLESVRLGKTPNFDCEFRVLTDQSTYVWVLARGKAIEFDEAGVAIRLLGTLLENTDRKNAEFALKQSEAEAKALFESNIDAICCVEEGVVTECNPMAPNVFGFASSEELIGKSVFDFSPEFQSDGMSTMEKFVKVMEFVERDKHHRFEWTHVRSDGTTYEVDVSMIKVDTDARSRFYTFVRDISQRKEMERQLAQAQKLESIGELAAGVAHEINTPMQCVFTNVEFLQDALKRVFDQADTYRMLRHIEDLPEEVQQIVAAAEAKCRFDRLRDNVVESIQDAAEASNRVVEIVRAMKTMSHPGTTDKVPSVINKLIEDAVIISRNRWKDVAEVDIDLDESIGEIPLLPAQISQLVLNLVVNAADAIADKKTGDGGLGVISLRTRNQSDHIQLEVQDSGTGMAPQVIKRIFDPFFTTKDVGKGTGQGLAIGHEVVVRQHSGTINVDSEVGVGTTFRICLPKHTTEADSSDDTREVGSQVVRTSSVSNG